ncbi:MAG: hypothetical protein ACTTJ4_09355 [Treponema sp.]|uniref:hypothetical protein n=1 Tax=Treponema sp. TaxID=166 RepID=UPI003FA2C6AE
MLYMHTVRLMQIKELCPQTVFYGTDVGHQYSTTEERFQRYLESKQQRNIPAYLRAQEIIQQGIAYYNGSAYRLSGIL